MSILPLPRDVVALIKSSTTITSLNGVVCELAKNSLDSRCTKIEISVDYAKGGCVVEDNGFGISPTEFREGGGLGKLHHSSKLNSKTPLHGTRGIFIASLSSMALLSITSHHQMYHSHNTIGMHKSEVITRQTPAPAYQNLKYTDHGTRVTVRDLFGNVPVRVKQRAIVAEKYRGNNKDWEDLKRSIVLLLLAWPEHVSITIRELGTVQKFVIKGAPGTETSNLSVISKFSVPRICNILAQASFISPEEMNSWVGVSLSAEQTQINGSISLDPSATKHNQFISFGIQPVLAIEGQTMLHDEINRLFSNSSFGNDEDAEDLNHAERLRRSNDERYKSDGYTVRELKGNRKGVDRWPMFYINIQTRQECTASQFNVDDILDNKKDNLGAILELLQAMVFEFMSQHYFRTGNKRRARTQQDNKPSPEKRSQNSNGQYYPANSPRVVSAPPSRTAIFKSSGSRIPSALGLKKDLLGVNVKFPSFRSSSLQIDSPFDSWTKVKKGSANPEMMASKYVTDRDSTALPISEIEQTGSKSHNRTRLLSSSGNIIRRPFEEAEISTAHPQSTTSTFMETPRPVPRSSNDDEVIEWINPITKVKSLVNQRTGLSVPAKPIPSRRDLNSFLSNDGGRITPRSASRNSNRPAADSNSSPWITGMLKNWENPVFAPVETSIPEVSLGDLNDAARNILYGHNHVCSQIDVDRAFKDSSRTSNRISKESLKHAKVISQVDKKFILVELGRSGNPLVIGNLNEDRETLLVIIDQHAADERIRIEALMEELCTPNDQSAGSGGVTVLTTRLEKSLTFEVSSREAQIFCDFRAHFSRWGIIYELTENEITFDDKAKKSAAQRIQVRSLPPCISERCKSDPRLLIELIRTEAWKCVENPPATTPLHPIPTEDNHGWLSRIQNCPQGLLDMLNSRACRSAIMFNDVLSLEQCEVLVKNLSNCAFPFQCAHGRPSLIPLVDLGTFDAGRIRCGEDERGFREGMFGEAFGKWKGEIRRDK